MNLKIQRFPVGHVYHSDTVIMHNNQRYQAIFGQMVDSAGSFICYTMERKDTLTPEGTYPFTYYNSPANKMVVPLMHNIPGFELVEIHIANWPYEVKGCTAVGMAIDVKIPQLISSGKAFGLLMGKLNMGMGQATYEIFKG